MNIGIIGAGASGSVCAIKLASLGFKVFLFERKDRILKKVLVTGNGTCNFTNIYSKYENFYSLKDKVYEKIFQDYSYKDVLEFFQKLGIEYTIKSHGRVYPLSLQASSVVDALRFKIDSMKNIELLLNFDVIDIKKEKDKFLIKSENETFKVDKLIIATGGKSYPELGSNGSGYELAKKFNHKVTKLYPILVQLKVLKEYIKGLEGVKQVVKLSVYNKEKFLRCDENELLFTPYGISGPSVFNLSYLTALNNIDDLIWKIDFMPNYSKEKLKELLINRKEILKHLSCEFFLNGLVNKKLGQFLLKQSGLEKLNVLSNMISNDIIEKLVNLLKEYTFKVYDTTGFSNAQVTAGGIYLNEVDEISFESKKVKDLYFIGEILDVFGDCGGYNLTWCFLSAFNVSKYIGDNCV